MTDLLSARAWTAVVLAGDHLWQSTVFLAGIAVLAWVLRHDRARVRHALWLAASAKFLVPAAGLVAVGRWLGALLPSAAGPQTAALVGAVDLVGEPFSNQLLPSGGTPALALPPGIVATGMLVVWGLGAATMLARWGSRWRRAAQIVRDATPVGEGDEWETLRRVQTRCGVTTALPLVSTHAVPEPGIFGIRRPVLLWPRSLTGRLDQQQVAAVLTHELAHVRRRDNLAAALHAAVETLFWFHPLVRWVGRRLVDERERACDEAVLAAGTAPRVYAESLVETCRCSVQPLPGLAGVAGSDLTRRVEDIMTNRLGRPMTMASKLLVTLTAALALTGPLAIGALSAPRSATQTESGVTQSLAGQIERVSDDVVRFVDNVELSGGSGDAAWRFHADEVEFHQADDRLLIAGNVVFSSGPWRIAADAAQFDTDEMTGVFRNARGAMQLSDAPEFFRDRCGADVTELALFGEVIEKLGQTYRVTRGGAGCTGLAGDWQVVFEEAAVGWDDFDALPR